MIFALARRTASVRVGRVFGRSVLGRSVLGRSVVGSSPPAVGIIGSIGSAEEPRAAGCTFMGPADVVVRSGMRDNTRLLDSFDPGAKSRAG